MAAWLKFFYSAMSGPDSYAGGGKATPIPFMPGWKGYVVQGRAFQLVDRYLVLPNGFSTGTTVLQENDRVILHMQYGGHYPKEVTPFLRSVLKAEYNAGADVVNGFRGPKEKEADGLVYRNRVYHPPHWCDVNNLSFYALHVNDYMHGAGQEAIFRREGKHLLSEGWHDYQYAVFKPR